MALFRFALIASALAMVGCGGGNSSTGTLSVAITDAPVDNASDVVIEVTGVEVHRNGGAIDFDFPSRPIHLLDLADGASELLLDGQTLPAGHYQWLRLKVYTAGNGDSYLITRDGTIHEIKIPSGEESGLKAIRGFDVAEGGEAQFVIDFDLRKSLVDPQGNEYIMKPVVRIVDQLEVGVIAGTVEMETYNCGSTAADSAVYVYAGRDIVPSDINTVAGTGPLVVAPVREPDARTNAYHYRAAFLPAGDYTVALTCDASSDTPEGAETLDFSQNYNVTVTAGNTTRQDFPAAP